MDMCLEKRLRFHFPQINEISMKSMQMAFRSKMMTFTSLHDFSAFLQVFPNASDDLKIEFFVKCEFIGNVLRQNVHRISTKFGSSPLIPNPGLEDLFSSKL